MEFQFSIPVSRIVRGDCLSLLGAHCRFSFMRSSLQNLNVNVNYKMTDTEKRRVSGGNERRTEVQGKETEGGNLNNMYK